MNRNYIYLTFLILILSAGVFFLPERNNEKFLNPEDLMWDIMNPSRFITTDNIAQMIIEKDPTLELIDVRSVDEYNDFTLQGAINIPLDSLCAEGYQDYLGIEDMNAVFFSNDDIKADQAWVIARRLGFGSIYVLKGGLNCWINTIIIPKMPVETASSEAFEQYNFRKGASMYFTGAEISSDNAGEKSSVKVTRKKKKAVAEGGC